MIDAATLVPLLDLYHQSVVGLRRAEAGRANFALDNLLARLQGVIEGLDPASQEQFAPLLGQMLAAKQRGDSITLADLIEYEMPATLRVADPGLSMPDVALIERLRSLNVHLGDRADLDMLRQRLDGLRGDVPGVRGLSVYHAWRCIEAGRVADALCLLRDEDERGSHSRQSAGLLLQSLVAAGDAEAAESLGDWFAREYPEALDAHFAAADIHRTNGDIAAATRLARKDIAAGRASAIRLLDAAEWLAQSGDLAQAIALVERAYACDDRVRGGFARLAWQLLPAGNWIDMFALIQRDEIAGRLDSGGRSLLAHVYGELGQLDRAVALLEKTYAEDPAPQNAFAWLATVPASAGRWGEALAIARRDAEAGRLAPDQRLWLAELYQRNGDADAARAEVALAYAADPALRDGHLRLALRAIEAGDWAEAGPLIREDFAADRLDPTSYGILAQVVGRDGDFDRAVALIEAAYAADAGPRNSFAWLAWIKADARDWQGALQLAERDVDADRLTPDWMIHVADIYAHCDLWDEAERLVGRAYDADPALRDGFARLANVAIQQRAYAKAVAYVDRDVALARGGPAGRGLLAGLRPFRLATGQWPADEPDDDAQRDYLAMQREHYTDLAASSDYDATDRYKRSNQAELIVGSYADHSFYPYEALLFPEDLDTSDLCAIDYGCGPGRMIERLARRFRRIDGVDICADALAVARANCADLPFDPRLIQTDGRSIPGVEAESYGLAYSVICLQHICVHAIRLRIFAELFRVLEPGGLLCLQMGYGVGHQAAIDYFEDQTGAAGTNGMADTMVLHPNDLIGDLARVGFRTFAYDLAPTGPGDTHSAWIFMRARKTADTTITVEHAGQPVDPAQLLHDQINHRIRAFNSGLLLRSSPPRIADGAATSV